MIVSCKTKARTVRVVAADIVVALYVAKLAYIAVDERRFGTRDRYVKK